MVAGLNRFLTLLRVLRLYRWRSNRNLIVATRLKGVETTRGEGEGYRVDAVCSHRGLVGYQMTGRLNLTLLKVHRMHWER